MMLDVPFCPNFMLRQTIEPSLLPSAILPLLSFIEGDAFCGSRHMPLDDALLVLEEDMLTTIPGLPRGPAIAIRNAIRNARQVKSGEQERNSDKVDGSTPLGTQYVSKAVDEGCMPCDFGLLLPLVPIGHR